MNFLFFWLPDMANIDADFGGLKGCMWSVGLGQSDFIGNVGVDPLRCSGFGGKGRNGLFNEPFLPPFFPVFLVLLLVPYHFEVLDFGVGEGRETLFESVACVGDDPVEVAPFILQLEGSGLEHGQLRESGHHLAGDILQSGLVVVHLLGQLERLLASIDRLFPQLFREIGDFIEDEFLFEQSLLLGVESLLEHLYFSVECFWFSILSFELPPPVFIFWVFEFVGQFCLAFLF